ncbi:MAG TPA: cyclic nucleotide-binding domain-containing protein [bacterium]|nr:cyclic nucleotide-binding domain-containing protein [bacterium]HPS30006.1 cyclic nucleotide-binding domain-containing protein [bacterium]
MERTFSTGTVILEKNSISNLFFVIIRGKVKFESGNKTFFLSDNDFFGEESAFLRKSNPYSIVASEETVIQIFDIQEAKDYIFGNPKIFFSLFIKNVSKTWECIESVSEKHPAYIGFIEKIFPYITKGDTETPVAELGITLTELSSRIGIEPERITSLISSIEHLGHIRMENNGKIFTIGKKNFQKLTGAYYENRNFALMTELKGCGSFPLLNKLKNKEF